MTDPHLAKGIGWGIYPWFQEHGWDRIHPDSRETVLQNHPYGHVFKLLDVLDEKWILLEGIHGRLVVDGDLFLTVSWPRFDFGEPVHTLPPRTALTGIISEIRWHDKTRQVFYLLSCDGKKLSGKYWDTELASATTKQ